MPHSNPFCLMESLECSIFNSAYNVSKLRNCHHPVFSLTVIKSYDLWVNTLQAGINFILSAPVMKWCCSESTQIKH